MATVKVEETKSKDTLKPEKELPAIAKEKQIEKPAPETDEPTQPVFCFQLRPSGVIPLQEFRNIKEGLERLKKGQKKGKFFFVEVYTL